MNRIESNRIESIIISNFQFLFQTSKRIRKAEDVSTNVLPESDPLEVESNVDVETIPQLRISKRNSKKSTIKAVEQPIIHAATHFEPKEQSTQQFDETLAIDQEITENRTPAPEFINVMIEFHSVTPLYFKTNFFEKKTF